MNSHEDELFKLVEQWASHFGYYDSRIDLNSGGNLWKLVKYLVF
jgi:hypothetical protein